MKVSTRVRELNESVTLAVSNKAAKMKAEGIDVISFGAGEPDFDTPADIAQAGIDAVRAGYTRYAHPTSGIPEAKQAVCNKFSRDDGLHYTPDQVIITAGGKMAVYLAIQAAIDPGDEVIVPVPYWVSYPEMVKLAGGKPVFVHGPEELDYKLRPDDLQGSLTERTRMFIFTSPSNPSGVTYNPGEVQALADVLRNDRNILVVSDEIYGELVYEGQQAVSFAAVSPQAFAQTVTVHSASKAYAMTGWRIGYAAGPQEIITGMQKIQTQTTSGAATFTQHALAYALNSDQQMIERMRREFEKRGARMWQRLCAMPGVRCPKPTGSFVCFPNILAHYAPLGVTGSAEFAQKLLEKAGVAVVPGSAFGMDGHIRLSFATSMKLIEEGLNRIESFLTKAL